MDHPKNHSLFGLGLPGYTILEMFGCSKLHFPLRCFGCSKLQLPGHLLGWWCHWSPKNGGCRTRFFVCFPRPRPSLAWENSADKKIRDDEGNGQLFCSDFLSSCDISILEKIDKNELKPKSTPWIYPQPMTTMANKGLYSIGSIGDIPQSPQKWFHVASPHEVSPPILLGRLLDPRWLPASVLLASDSLLTFRDKTVRKRPSNPSASAIFPLFLGSKGTCHIDNIVFLLLPPLHRTTKICGLKQTHHKNLLVLYRTPRCVFFRISPSSSECCPNKEPNLQSEGRKNWRKTSLPVTNWPG